MSNSASAHSNSGNEVGAVNPDQLAEAVVNLLRSIMQTSLASAVLEGTEILLTIDEVHTNWLARQWESARSLCRDGVEICTIWKDNDFSYVPVLAQGILYIYAGSCELLGKRTEGWGLEAIQAFRYGRECLRNLMHMDSNSFEAVTCLGLATAYYVCGNYEQAAHASSNGLTLLPNNQHFAYRRSPDGQATSSRARAPQYSTTASNTYQLRHHLKHLHDWARLKRQL